MIKLYQDKDWLGNKYSKELHSDSKIAKLCMVDPVTIWNWRKRFSIDSRNHNEAIHLSKANHCNLSRKAIEWISGELLGDGHLCSLNHWSAAFHYGSSKEEYINYTAETLNSFGIKQSGKINKQYHKEMNCYSYHYNSLSYEELLIIRRQWYPNSKKIVPRDIELTPLTVRQWYIGDGSLNRFKNSLPGMTLGTQGFPISNVEYLIIQLIKLGFKSTRHKDNTIYISIHSTQDFLNYIGPCPVKCYQYKWNIKNNIGGDN